jgi:hypothetical protein
MKAVLGKATEITNNRRIFAKKQRIILCELKIPMLLHENCVLILRKYMLFSLNFE